ncbi:O-antigen ligase family protein [Salinimonas lutimaris]|uniref:O-antigen ligase family protein n=1 Tax=Salinimonas lutimaris TaxID=914153 RepID=UPI0010C09B6C|nr:O-antigen ligase family protein [Salinimonas lutimaris]
MKTQVALKDTDFIFLKVKNLWTHFKSESFAFKCICMYIFLEYFKPQAIFPVVDILPWAQIFLVFSFLGLFFDKKSNSKINGLYFLIVIFFLIINLSILYAFNRAWAMQQYIIFSQWVLIIFLISSIVTTRERFYIFFTIFFLCCFKIAFGTAKNWVLRGFSFTGWGLMGPPGYFQNSGELAVLMLIFFPLSYYLYVNLKDHVNKWEKYFLLVATISPILTLLGCSSRGAQLALLLQLVIMFYRKIFKPKYLIVIGLVAVLGWQLLPQEQKERFTEIGEDKTSIQRQLYWENGWEMMKEHPFLGVGYFNFQPYYQVHYPQDMLYKRAQLPHNIFIQVGTDAGFIGLLVFMLIILGSLLIRFPAKYIVEVSQTDKLYSSIWSGLKIGIIGFALAGQFVTIAYYPFLWISIALLISLSKSLEGTMKKKVS